MRLGKQIGHFTGTVAVIGKKMGLCAENISPGHGSQIGWLSDISDVYSADCLPKAPLLDTWPASIPGDSQTYRQR